MIPDLKVEPAANASIAYKKRAHAFRNIIHFRSYKVRTHRKTYELVCESLCDRKLAFSPAILRKRWLQVNGRRITDHSIDAFRLEMVEEQIALLGSDNEQVEYVLFAFEPRLKLEGQIRESFAILTGNLSSLFIPAVQARELPQENLCLNGIEFRVVANAEVIVLIRLT